MIALSDLTNREREIVSMVVQGKSNKETGDQLYISEKTIKFHLTSIYRKLGVTSRAQLIVLVLRDLPTFDELQGFYNAMANQ